MTAAPHFPVDFYRYAAPKGVTVSERYLTVGDGMSLHLIDFQPPGQANDQSAAAANEAVHGKPWLLFLPGWLSQPTGWGAFLSEITPHYRVLYLESREKSSSVAPMANKVSYEAARMVTDVQEAVRQIVPPNQPWLLSGSSLGSSVALEYLAAASKGDCPPPNEALLIAPNLTFAFPKWAKPIFRWFPLRLYPVLAAAIKAYIRWFKVDMKREPEQYQKYASTIDSAAPHKLRPNALSLFDYDGWRAAKTLTTPTTLVGGQSDGMHGLADLKRVTELNRYCTLVEMKSNKATHSDEAGRLLKSRLDATANPPASLPEQARG